MRNLAKRFKLIHMMHLLPVFSVLIALCKNYLGTLLSVYLASLFLSQWVLWILKKPLNKLLRNPLTIQVISVAALIYGGYQLITGISSGEMNSIILGGIFLFSSICLFISEIIREK